jgi:hypothetical protein
VFSQDLFSEQWIDFSVLQGHIFKIVLHLYWAPHVSPLSTALTPDKQIQFLTREVKDVIDYVEPILFFKFIAQHNIYLQMNQL